MIDLEMTQPRAVLDRPKFRRRKIAAARSYSDSTTSAVSDYIAKEKKVERRRQIDPTTCERDYTADEIEFMRAMDEYKRTSGRQFPTWSEVLEVVRSMGYKRG